MLPLRSTHAALRRVSAVLLFGTALAGCFTPDPADDIDPPAYTVVVGPITPAAPGGTGSLDLYVVRADGFDLSITVDPSPPQAALQWSGLTIPAGVTEIRLPFSVPAGASAGTKLINITTQSNGNRPVSVVASVPVTAAGTFLLTMDAQLTVGNPGMTFFRGYRAARNGVTTPISLSVVASPGITVILPFPQLAAGEETGSVEIRIPGTTLPGNYSVTLVASAPPLADQAVTFSVTVTNATFAVSLDESAVWIPQNGTAEATTMIQRFGGYNNGVEFSATAPQGIGVTFSGPLSSRIVTVSAGQAVAPGPYLVTVIATGPATPPKSTSLTVNVLPGPTGAPAAIHIAPPSASVRVDGTQTFVATLLDANGNRTMPATGADIEIVTVFSGVANVTSTQFYPNQREQRAVVKGLAPGTTDVRAYYRVNGVRVLGPVASPLTVTP